MKTNSYINTTQHGGTVPILKKIKEFGIPQAIRKCLGVRKKQSKYQYSDIIISWILTNYCGGTRLDHITWAKDSLAVLPNLKLPSHDTLGRAMKKLSTKTVRKRTYSENRKKFIVKKINENKPLSQLLIAGTKRTGILKEGLSYTLDLDATFIPTECSDAELSYNAGNGFCPMVSSIGPLTVFVSMRNGNVSPSTDIKLCLKKTLTLLGENKIKIGKVRMDSASYSQQVFTYLDGEGIKFYVAGISKPNIKKKLGSHVGWRKVTIQTTNTLWKCEGADLLHNVKGGEKEYRMVALRSKLRKGKRPATWIKSKKYAYKLIMTNDFDSSIEEIVEFYNQRGTSEKNFDVLKNDFGWKFPPFSNMNENTVFLIIAALTNNIYQAILKDFKQKISQLTGNMRLPRFSRIFISCSCSFSNGKPEFNKTIISYEKLMV